MTLALRLLLLLGLLGQGLMAYAFRSELVAMARGDLGGSVPELLAFLTPALLGCGGAVLGTALRRRGSAWAWPVVAVPLLLLALGLAGTVYLTFYPPPMHGGSAGLPL